MDEFKQNLNLSTTRHGGGLKCPCCNRCIFGHKRKIKITHKARRRFKIETKNILNTEFNNDEILESLKKLQNTKPNISYDEFWKRMDDLIERENEAFNKETKKLKMSQEQFNRCFDI